jgi:putative oxidoreductase
LQKRFYSFPSGSPGFGLLLLRLVLAGVMVVDGSRSLIACELVTATSPGIFAFLLIICGALVGLGFLTPLIPTIVVVVNASALGGHSLALGMTMPSGPWQVAVFEAAVAASLVLIGPGAYSMDASLSGRQEINIPPLHPPAS